MEVILKNDRGFEESIIKELKIILGKEFNYEIEYGEKDSKILLRDIDENDIKKIIINSKTIKELVYKDRVYDLINRGYEFEKKNLDPVSISKIIYYYDIYKCEKILTMFNCYIPIELGIIIKNIPTIFWRKKEFEFDIFFENKKEKKKIQYVNFISEDINKCKISAINALVKDVILFSRIDYEYIDIKLNEEYDVLFADITNLNKDIKYILYYSKVLAKNFSILISSQKDLPSNLLKRYKLVIRDVKEFYSMNNIFYCIVLDKAF